MGLATPCYFEHGTRLPPTGIPCMFFPERLCPSGDNVTSSVKKKFQTMRIALPRCWVHFPDKGPFCASPPSLKTVVAPFGHFQAPTTLCAVPELRCAERGPQ